MLSLPYKKDCNNTIGYINRGEEEAVLNDEPCTAITLPLVDIKSPYLAKSQETIKANSTRSEELSQTARETARNHQR